MQGGRILGEGVDGCVFEAPMWPCAKGSQTSQGAPGSTNTRYVSKLVSTKDKEANPLLNGANGISAEDWKDVEVQDTADTPPTTTINRELEAVKATAENLKKKFVSWAEKFKKKN